MGVKRKVTLNSFRERAGFVSIEAIFAMSMFLMLFLLLIGFFSYIYPQTTLNREVHALATLAQRQGGLTLDDVDSFVTRIEEYQFVDTSRGEIEVSAYTTPGDMDAIGVNGLDEAGAYYVKRDSKELIELTVTVPSYNQLLTPVARFFGVSGVSEHYAFREIFMSERY
ncbi:hypothetical protein NDS46_31110 (plasmid) [Paenibacillus thiaminolyticus]|uniref:hypothetical protein n=1 Tax=Paenibacillus thiaminolyticus TaxID=49283 RepID=UPI00232F2E23|nr:hypothetical protein [Paenibacillus thiaminolyticus]WCF11408.1 hypothetical protein NDS46_31110 [Paenibacillus thiaminolyticus]